MKLTEGLYAYPWDGNDNNCNTYLFADVLDGGKHIIIDPGHVITPYLGEDALTRLIDRINNDELKPEDIGMVILTHAHPDHIESAWSFKEKYNSVIGLGKGEIDLYKQIGGTLPIDFYIEAGSFKYQNMLNTNIEIHNIPGHSPGHIAVYWIDKKALAVGDLIFYHNTGRIDLPGGNGSDLKKSIDNLSKLDVEYLLCGHPYQNPGVITGKEAVIENFDFLKKYIWF